jgi:hypothetical protein
MVDENCTNRYDFVFNPNNSAGLWNFTFLTYVNDTLAKTSTGSVYIQEDVHGELHNGTQEEESDVVLESSESNEISNQTIAAIIALISLFAMAVIVSQMDGEKPFEEE